ncbi:MAG: zinc ribbon domain-containing protein [Nitrospiraceae bacterium]
MFCSDCGAEASGNFCWKCGAKLYQVGQAKSPSPTGVDPSHPVVVDWSNEVRYKILIAYPEVRDLLARQTSFAKKPISGEDFLASVDKVIEFGVSVEQIARIAQPLATRLGIKTGKVRTEVFSLPPGRVIVGVLCSMARRGQSLHSVDQAQDGCAFEAAIPSDMWSFEGSLFVTVRRQKADTSVEAATRIPGQLFDWGKSQSILNDLFSDLPKIAV